MFGKDCIIWPSAFPLRHLTFPIVSAFGHLGTVTEASRERSTEHFSPGALIYNGISAVCNVRKSLSSVCEIFLFICACAQRMINDFSRVVGSLVFPQRGISTAGHVLIARVFDSSRDISLRSSFEIKTVRLRKRPRKIRPKVRFEE